MRRDVIRRCITFILLFIPYTIKASRFIESASISKPIKSDKNFLIILLTPESKFRTSATDYDDVSIDYSVESSQEESEKLTTKDDEAYFLYHILRTTEKEYTDSKTALTIKKTKEILQPILRSRCRKLEKCKKKCPRRNVTICVKKCVIQIDIFIVCEPKPKNKCKKSKCGKTMPPDWL